MDIVEAQAITYKKSNFIISSKYKASLIENKLLAIATSRLSIVDGCPYAKITMSEVKSFFGLPKENTNIYPKIRRAVKALVSHPVIIEDYDSYMNENNCNEKGNILALALITKATYKNGKIEIYFNKEFNPLVTNLKNNFTLLELQTLMQFEEDYSFRLYEVLRKEVYKIKGNGCVSVYYDLPELKCIIGVVNINQTNARMAVESGKSWEEIVNDIKIEKSFKDWSEFNRNVLVKAQKEINEKTDISIQYEKLTRGRGGKTVGITFYITKNNYNYGLNYENKTEIINIDQNKELNLFEYDDKVNSIVEYTGNSITFDQSYDLFKCASYDIDVVKKAYDYSKEQKYIDNLMGWMKWCIKNKEYETKKIPMVDGDVKKGKEIVEIMNDYNDNKDDYSKIAWNKIKDKPDFNSFLEYYDLEIDMLELTKSSEECIRLYVDWKLKR